VVLFFTVIRDSCDLHTNANTTSFYAPGHWWTRKNKKPGAAISKDISAARLSHGDPEGFPPHPREWLSIIVYLTQFDASCK